jgi:hypothetical protein
LRFGIDDDGDGFFATPKPRRFSVPLTLQAAQEKQQRTKHKLFGYVEDSAIARMLAEVESK